MGNDNEGGAYGPLLLVHGAWHSAWCWSRILDQINPRCERVLALELPFDSIESDTAAVRDALIELGPNTVICAHSYGGRLASIVADEVPAAHLLYIAAPTPNLEQLGAYATADRLRGGEVPDFKTAWGTFYNRSDEATARVAWEHLRPMRTAPGTTVGLDHRPWEHIPSTYVVCLEDNALRPEVQRSMAANMTDFVTIDSDHSPFLTAPNELASIVNGVLARSSGV
ncbi:MAG TPA: alpha/beta hydrolase [Galbitalea sp.]|jgi:pimeloyl-ACP methyl ester carboxylesterase|nr:alpha/beta hydrolase [Galbitalea sp.]